MGLISTPLQHWSDIDWSVDVVKAALSAIGINDNARRGFTVNVGGVAGELDVCALTAPGFHGQSGTAEGRC